MRKRDRVVCVCVCIRVCLCMFVRESFKYIRFKNVALFFCLVLEGENVAQALLVLLVYEEFVMLKRAGCVLGHSCADLDRHVFAIQLDRFVLGRIRVNPTRCLHAVLALWRCYK